MGRAWDGWESPAGYQRWCAAWAAECLRVLKPGGHLLAFGGTRTWHRLACAIEDARFEIRDTITWLYGSGFPKSLDVGKSIDRIRDWTLVERLAGEIKRARAEAGLSLAQIGQAMQNATDGQYGSWYHRGGHMFFETGRSLPSRPEWERLQTVLPIRPEFADVYAQAEREVIGETTTNRSGGSWADMAGTGMFRAGERVVQSTAPATEDAARWDGWGTALKPASEPIVVARKPLAGTVAANVLTHGTGALNIAATRVAGPKGVPASPRRAAQGPAYGELGNDPGTGSGWDPNVGRWPSNVVLTHGDCTEDGCEPGCPVAELDAQSGTLTSGANPTRRGTDKLRDAYGDFKGQEDCTPARGADTGGASRFFPAFRYEAKADAAERPRAGDTAHPTVKPLALMRWLVRLVTPPGGLVLDPFAGSGTTAEACIVEGFRCITIEREADYLPLIVHRITRRTNPVAHLTAQAERGEDVDLGLFGLLDDLGGVA